LKGIGLKQKQVYLGLIKKKKKKIRNCYGLDEHPP
jgi:hypothetical protein